MVGNLTSWYRAATVAAEETGNTLAGAITAGMWVEWSGLILLSPLVAFLLILFFGKRWKRQGAEFAIAALAFNSVWSLVLFVLNLGDGVFYQRNLEIARIGSLGGKELVFELGWMVDGLSIMMFLLVNLVGLVVFIYAVGYMEGEIRVTWFFAAFSLFAGSMLVLVGASNLVTLIIGWEGVGLASYLLIGHYWEKKENSSAGMKAFYTNKVADVGLILGAVVVGVSLGSFRFTDLAEASAAGSELLAPVATAAGLLLFWGAMGKSAQFPLHIWLPDAMAGPTPVSALMHAATMVTGGVYLMARLFPFYQHLADSVRPLLIAVGAITLLGMGLVALVQNDIKKVLAYSTVSQLGYMMTAVAAGGYTAGLFHLFTHAFFKALLFLGAGAVIHAVHSNHMTDMGGLRRFMPITYRTFLIGSLALAGIFPLAGFWSKDEILATLSYEGYVLVLWVGILGAFVTAFYMARTISLTFHGDYHGTGQPHEASRIMTGPLVALAIPSVLVGLANIPGVKWPGLANFTEWLAIRVVPMGDHHAEAITWWLAGVGLLAALAGLVVGWLVYRPLPDLSLVKTKIKAPQAGVVHPSPVPALGRDVRLEIPLLYPLLRQKYFLDHVALGVVGVVKGPLARGVNWVNDWIIDTVVNASFYLSRRLAHWIYGGIDQRGVDLAINSVAGLTDTAGNATRRWQGGRVQGYAASVVGGIVVLVVLVTLLGSN